MLMEKEFIRGALMKLIRQYPNHLYVSDGLLGYGIDRSDKMADLAEELEKLEVLFNKNSITRNGISGNFDIERAREVIQNELY